MCLVIILFLQKAPTPEKKKLRKVVHNRPLPSPLEIKVLHRRFVIDTNEFI